MDKRRKKKFHKNKEEKDEKSMTRVLREESEINELEQKKLEVSLENLY